MANSPHFRGYTRVGGELTGGRPTGASSSISDSKRQRSSCGRGDPAWTRLQGPNQWPAQPAGLKAALLDWQARCNGLAPAAEGLRAVARPACARRSSRSRRGLPNQRHEDRALSGPRRERQRRTGRPGCRRAQGRRLPDAAAAGRNGWSRGLRDGRGSTRSRFPAVSSSTPASCSNWPRMATTRPRRTASSHRRAPRRGNHWRSSSRHGWTPWCPACRCRRNCARRRAGRPAKRANPLFREVATNTLKGRLRSHPDVASATMRICSI